MAKRVTCCAVAIRRGAHAPELIDRAVRTALLERKPAYIELPTNVSREACAHPGPMSAIIEPNSSDWPSLDSAVIAASEFLRNKQKPVILVGPKVRRVGAEKALFQLAEAIGCAIVLQPAAKGTFLEGHSQFAGIFWGQVSTLAADTIVNWADVLICIGTIFTDYSTVGWTALPDVPQLVADIDSVTLVNPSKYSCRVQLDDFLSRLAETVTWNNSTMVEYNRHRLDLPLGQAPRGEEKLTRKEVARQTQLLLSSETTMGYIIECRIGNMPF
ncbi:pyruvate decarboxylase [Trichoderma arundinaceum]|uniref:pyruvate decarboxylase n=1 Tax=Trichoderma arundinaceum TaxID=490622 RepID=A0A395N9G1_TRIAR|nr:pyruvate decarboxylase [Trichoderma arundinaceum]